MRTNATMLLALASLWSCTEGAVTGPESTSTPNGCDIDGACLPAPACAPMPFPSGCEAGVTTLPEPGDFGSPGPFTVTVETLPNPRGAGPGPVSIYRPDGEAGVPVLFFSHAFGATMPSLYEGLFRTLASNRLAVVYVPYPTIVAGASGNATRYAWLWEGFKAAAQSYATTFDLTKVGFFGHSFGGGATPEMARRGFVEEGWGSAGRMMFVMAPWYSWGSDYETLPTDVRAIVQVYADDDVNEHDIAVADIWEHLPSELERRWLLVRSDACECGLTAGHVVPIGSDGSANENEGGTENGHDVWAVWRRVHALSAYAFGHDAAARAVAYGEDAAMGRWLGCDERAVVTLEAADTPILAHCQTPKFALESRCSFADEDTPCPPVVDEGPTDAERLAAATTTAESTTNDCAAIQPFYWEVGRAGGLAASGSVGTTYNADTVMSIASASKWLYSGYVVERRAGEPTPEDIKFLTFRSGYTNFAFCLPGQTVDGCLESGSNGEYSSDTDGYFSYGGGHMQKHASLMGLGAMNNAALAAELRSQLGAEVALSYNQPQLAGGAVTSAADYAKYLRKLLSGDLRLGALLGSHAVCTNPTTCAQAKNAPVPDSEEFHYSLGHWVEDDPVDGDGAFSSAGAFGFYPWIDAEKTSYGIVAREARSPNAGYASLKCGHLIRQAWLTATPSHGE